MRPSAVPRTVPSSVAAGAMIMMSRAPTMTRENTSRPRRSVPNQLSALGDSRACSGLEANGSCSTTSFPKSAQSTQKPTMIAPAMNDFECRSTRTRSRRAIVASSRGGPTATTTSPRGSIAEGGGVPALPGPRFRAGPAGGGGSRRSLVRASEPDPRVEDGVQDVGHQRRDEEDDADDEHRRFERREVLLRRRTEDHLADPLVVEDELDHDEAAHQVADLRGDDRD